MHGREVCASHALYMHIRTRMHAHAHTLNTPKTQNTHTCTHMHGVAFGAFARHVRRDGVSNETLNPKPSNRDVYGAVSRHVRRNGTGIEQARSECAREHRATREGGRGQHRAVPRSRGAKRDLAQCKKRPTLQLS
jgi:hypothetical protein